MMVIDAQAIAASADGRCARPDFSVRPIEPTDAAALLRFHAHLSLRSVHLRYFYPHQELQPAEVTHLTCVDDINRAACVVEHGGDIIAVGRYDRLEDPLRRGDCLRGC